MRKAAHLLSPKQGSFVVMLQDTSVPFTSV